MTTVWGHVERKMLEMREERGRPKGRFMDAVEVRGLQEDGMNHSISEYPQKQMICCGDRQWLLVVHY